jgi:hypothetical protein
MESAVASAKHAHGVAAFGTLSGGALRYDSGSHIDLRYTALVSGFSARAELAPGVFTFGAFFEYGDASYDTYNAFDDAAPVRGRGSARHAGGGLLARLDLPATDPGYAYLEAAVRAGRLHNDYRNPDMRAVMRDGHERETGFKAAFPYVGLSAGLGYVLPVTGKYTWELSGHYLWTHQDGRSVRLHTGEPVRFDTTNSHRLRGSVRFSHAVSESLGIYLGVAYEHEFDADARAKVYRDYAIERPRLTGGTGIGEFGLSLKPTPSLPLSIDLGIQGHTGKREGVTGSLQVKWEF